MDPDVAMPCLNRGTGRVTRQLQSCVVIVTEANTAAESKTVPIGPLTQRDQICGVVTAWIPVLRAPCTPAPGRRKMGAAAEQDFSNRPHSSLGGEIPRAAPVGGDPGESKSRALKLSGGGRI